MHIVPCIGPEPFSNLMIRAAGGEWSGEGGVGSVEGTKKRVFKRRNDAARGHKNQGAEKRTQ